MSSQTFMNCLFVSFADSVLPSFDEVPSDKEDCLEGRNLIIDKSIF